MSTIPSRRKLAKLLDPDQTAKILGVKVTTLSNWRCNKRYNLPFVRIGRKIRYPEDGITAFIESRTEVDECEQWYRWLAPEPRQVCWMRANHTPWKVVMQGMGKGRTWCHQLQAQGVLVIFSKIQHRNLAHSHS